MVNIETISKEITKKFRFSKIAKENIKNYIKELSKDHSLENENSFKREILLDLNKIDRNLWDLEEDYEYACDENLNNYVNNLLENKKYKVLTIPLNDLSQIYNVKNGIEEYFEYSKLFKQKGLPQDSITDVIILPRKLKTRIINNLDEETFNKIIKNKYCKLYEEVEKNNNNISQKDREEFIKIINIKNNSQKFIPCEKDLKKDLYHVNTLQDLQQIDNLKANKLDELMDDKYSVYDIKREFCNRFMNIDPIILENCFYCQENKEILDNIEDIYLIKEIVTIGREDKKKMIDIYSRYMSASKCIEIPDNLLTYGYAYVTPEEVKEIKQEKSNFSVDKIYHEIYFCRECLLDSNQKKRDREVQLEIPIGVLRNNNQYIYENIVRNNIYVPNMAYPKIDLRKEEIESNWIKRDYLTIEAINSNVDINNPKRFDKEIPMSKNYSHLYDSYMYKEEYDIKEKERRDTELEEEMNNIFGTVGLTTDMVKNAMLKKFPEEDDPII